MIYFKYIELGCDEIKYGRSDIANPKAVAKLNKIEVLEVLDYRLIAEDHDTNEIRILDRPVGYMKAVGGLEWQNGNELERHKLTIFKF